MAESESDSTEEVVKTPSKKKAKRLMTRYKTEWEKEFPWVRQSDPDEKNCSKAFCKICNKSFTVNHGGRNDLTRHAKGVEHTKREKDIIQSKSLKCLFGESKFCKQESKVIAAELTKVYHSICHHQSFRALDCSMKLDAVLYPDSRIAGSVQCGRTKCSSLANNVLAPYSISKHLKPIIENNYYFAFATDASNHGSIKLFPIVLRYFCPESMQVKNLLLDYFEDADETAVNIFQNLIDKFNDSGLSLENASAFCADNANVNFGKNHSVYSHLKERYPTLLAANCNAHKIHNTVRYAIERCNFDLDGLVTKVFNYFSSHSKRVAELKEVFDYVDMEYKDMLRHVTTRWLSIFPAVERLLRNFPVLTQYFISLGRKCPANIKKFFSDINNDDDICRTEIYLCFLHNVLKIFHDTVLKLENENTISVEVYDLMLKLKTNLEERRQDKFFGYKAMQLLRKLNNDENDASIIETEFLKFYDDTIFYLNSRFDFSQTNFLNTIAPLSLTTVITMSEILTILNDLGISEKFDVDEMYEEYSLFRNSLEKLVNSNETCLDKWKVIFKISSASKTGNILKLIQFVLSIPSCNASVERIFSISKQAWSDVRNKLSTESIRSELQIKINFDCTCKDFYNLVLSDSMLINVASKNQKYVFKTQRKD